MKNNKILQTFLKVLAVLCHIPGTMSKWRYLTVSQFSCGKFIFLHCNFCVHAGMGLRLQLAEFPWTLDFSFILPTPIS